MFLCHPSDLGKETYSSWNLLFFEHLNHPALHWISFGWRKRIWRLSSTIRAHNHRSPNHSHRLVRQEAQPSSIPTSNSITPQGVCYLPFTVYIHLIHSLPCSILQVWHATRSLTKYNTEDTLGTSFNKNGIWIFSHSDRKGHSGLTGTLAICWISWMYQCEIFGY